MKLEIRKDKSREGQMRRQVVIGVVWNGYNTRKCRDKCAVVRSLLNIVPYEPNPIIAEPKPGTVTCAVYQ